MPAYTAKFADGRTKHIANSKREYKAGWQVKITYPDGRETVFMGFARDHGMAKAATVREVSHLVKPTKWNRGGPVATVTHTEIVDVERA